MIEFGANDCKSVQVEATWKAALQWQIEQYHTKWPNATVYVGLPWRSTSSTTILTPINTLCQWITDVVALYDYVEIGPDKRVWLENGDNGATYTEDGVHPNVHGYLLDGQQWLSVAV